jgi:hypothetical protein
MSNLVKILQSPFNPALEVVEDIIIQLHVPYSDTNVTIQVNPNVQDYQENSDNENIQVRQVMLTTSTDQTKTLSLDFNNNKKQSFDIEGSNYEIELMNIGKENIEGQDFPYFEFNVSKC